MSRPSVGLKSRLLFTLVLTVGFYALLESLVSLAHAYWWHRDVLLVEGSGARFCPIRGYRLPAKPVRYLRVCDNGLEYVGTYRGNNQGFADRDDFGPQRESPGIPRFAVLGDSFSAGTCLETNWPDQVEDLFAGDGFPVKLPNFSLDGIGLANWWSIVQRLLVAEDYDLDGVIFAVFANDLQRPFAVSDHRANYPRWGAADWSPTLWPSSYQEAQRFLKPAGRCVSGEMIARIVNQDLLPRNDFELVVTRNLIACVGRLFRPRLGTAGESGFDHDREPLVEDLRCFLEERRLPAIVVYIPAREELLGDNEDPLPFEEEARAFARALGASFVDGRQAFAGLSPQGICRHWYRHDGHWNQAGSDRFGKFMFEGLSSWQPVAVALKAHRAVY